MNKLLAILGGIGIGAGLMYIFDPKGGRRRRALIRDKAVGLSHSATDAIEGTAKDLSNRAKGLVHSAGSLISGQQATTGQAAERAK